MHDVTLQGTIITAISKKTGNPYEYVNITFPNGFQKRMFLEDSEMFILRQCINTAPPTSNDINNSKKGV